MNYQEKVNELGEKMGFGALMYAAKKGWHDQLVSKGYKPGGEFSLGPSEAMMVTCPHTVIVDGHCEICCGSGQVTRWVQKLAVSL